MELKNVENKIFYEGSFFTIFGNCENVYNCIENDCEKCNIVICDCSGCSENNYNQDNVSIRLVRNIKNDHCFYSTCQLCVCDDRNKLHLYEDEHILKHWDNTCMGKCEVCKNSC